MTTSEQDRLASLFGALASTADLAGGFHSEKPITGKPAESSGLLRGHHNKGKNGWSRRVHYEISGAGRIDYEYHPAYTTGKDGDEHPVVRILVMSPTSLTPGVSASSNLVRPAPNEQPQADGFRPDPYPIVN